MRFINTFARKFLQIAYLHILEGIYSNMTLFHQSTFHHFGKDLPYIHQYCIGTSHL
jgi:hypothetical protein